MNLSPKKTASLPAQVPSLPILGSTNGLLDPFGFLLKKYRQFGPIFRIKVLGETRYVMAGSEACRFFADSDPKLWNRSRLFGRVLRAMGLKSFVAATDGDQYQRLREAMRIAFSRQAALPFIETFVRRAGRIGEKFQSGGAVMPVMKQLCFDQLREFTCHDTTTWHCGDCEKASGMMLFAFLNSRLHRMFMVPKYAGAAQRTFSRAEQIVAAKNHHAKRQTRPDMLDLLRTQARAYADPLTDDELAGAVFFGWASGMGYSSRVHSFLLYCLLKNPEICEQVQAEVDRVFQIERPSPGDLRSMKVLRASILETLRLFPIQTVQPYQLNETIQFQGYEIPADSKIYFYPVASHYDPEIFVDPEKFDPARFLAPRNEHKQKFAFNAFGLHPRNCAGSGFVEILALCTIGPLMFNNRLKLTNPSYQLKIKARPIGGPCDRFNITAVSRTAPRRTLPSRSLLENLADARRLSESDLDENQAEQLRLACAATTIRKFEPRETVIRQGDAAEDFFMILSGNVQVQQTVGSTVHHVKTLNHGDYFGEIGLLEDCQRTANVVCGDSSVELAVIGKSVFLDLVRSCNLIGEEISGLLQERLLSNRLSQALPGIKPTQIEQVLGANTTMRFGPNEIVFYQGDEPDRAYIIVSGGVEVLNIHPSGQDIQIASLSSGQFFGEAGILGNAPRNATVRTTSEGAELIAIEKSVFRDIAQNQQLGRSLHSVMTDRISNLVEVVGREST